MCITPFGFPVEPLVYRMNKGSSASIISGSHKLSADSIASCHQTSLPSIISVGLPVLLTTRTFSIDGVFLRASSAFFFIGISVFMPLTPASCVTKTLHSESLILDSKLSGEKAPKTTECTAPILAQANSAIVNSGIICI